MPEIIPTIAFVRRTKHLTDAMVEQYVKAQQIQLDRDFKRAWGSTAKCLFTGGEPPPDQVWLCLLEDHSPDPDALGFHDLTSDGMPIMHVYVKDDMDSGLSWSVTASHEVIECVGDPWIDNTISVTQDGVTLEYARELADAGEDEAFAYPINGVLMSSFVTPAWFDPDAVAGPYSCPVIPQINAPFALAEGGYIGLRPKGGEWTQRFAMGPQGKRSIKRPSSRTMRRFNRAPVAA